MINENDIERTKQLFSAALTFLSILLGVFTLSLMNAVKWKGYPEGDPWFFLMLVSGFGIISSTIISAISFYHQTGSINQILQHILTFLLYSTLIICGVGTPVVGYWLFYIG